MSARATTGDSAVIIVNELMSTGLTVSAGMTIGVVASVSVSYSEAVSAHNRT